MKRETLEKLYAWLYELQWNDPLPFDMESDIDIAHNRMVIGEMLRGDEDDEAQLFS